MGVPKMKYMNTLSSAILPQSDQRHLLEELYRERKLYAYYSGESIPMELEEIWVVCRGVVQLSTLLYPSGDEVLLGLAGASMPFGTPLSSLGSYHATALTNVDLLRLTLSDIESSPSLSQGIFYHLGRRLRQTEAILALVGYRRTEERLHHLLLVLKNEVGQPVEGGTRLDVRLTHQQLANAIGATRVTVTRLLGKLRSEQWIKIDRTRHIVITPRAAIS